MTVSLLLSPELFAGEEAELAGDAFHHLLRVRRLEEGASLRVVDGEGHARSALLEKVGKKAAKLRLGEALPARDPQARLHLFVGALRPERASWLVEKATELGVSAVRFLNTERTPRQYGEGRLERFERVAQAALEQCQGARLPKISGVHAFAELAALLPQGPLWVLDPEASEGLAWPADPSPGKAPEAAVLIGPEGGFSPAELEHLATLGARGAFLGRRILRVETAAVAAAAILLARAC